MLKMNLEKTSEKIIIWMHRTGKTQQSIAKEIGCTRQTFAEKLKSNIFSFSDINTLKRLGFNA